MELSDDDVLEILKLFERSRFDFLELQHGERKITVSKGGYAAAEVSATPVPRSEVPPATAPPLAQKSAPIGDGLVPVTSPMVGTFYAAPSPADPPYAQVGARVEIGSTVGLIEVMKVFTSIKAETAGMVEQILVTSGQFVEFGQALFLLRPDAPAKEEREQGNNGAVS